MKKLAVRIAALGGGLAAVLLAGGACGGLLGRRRPPLPSFFGASVSSLVASEQCRNNRMARLEGHRTFALALGATVMFVALLSLTDPPQTGRVGALAILMILSVNRSIEVSDDF